MRVALFAFALASTLSRGAAAEEGERLQPSSSEPGGRPRPSVALLAGYGLPLEPFRGDVSPYRFGFGVRAGATFGFGGYLGGTFVKHLGTSRLGTRDGRSYLVTIAHDTYAGPELGWDFAISRRLLLRPFVGGGLLLTLGKTAVGTATVDSDRAWFYVAPGFLTALRFGELFAGIDLRVPIVPAQSVKQWAPTGMLVVGMELGAARRGPQD